MSSSRRYLGCTKWPQLFTCIIIYKTLSRLFLLAILEWVRHGCFREHKNFTRPSPMMATACSKSLLILPKCIHLQFLRRILQMLTLNASGIIRQISGTPAAGGSSILSDLWLTWELMCLCCVLTSQILNRLTTSQNVGCLKFRSINQVYQYFLSERSLIYELKMKSEWCFTGGNKG